MTECVVLPFPKRPRPTLIADAADAEIAHKWLIVRLFLRQNFDFDPDQAREAVEGRRTWDPRWYDEILDEPMSDMQMLLWSTMEHSYAMIDTHRIEAEIEMDTLDYEELFPEWTPQADC